MIIVTKLCSADIPSVFQVIDSLHTKVVCHGTHTDVFSFWNGLPSCKYEWICVRMVCFKENMCEHVLYINLNMCNVFVNKHSYFEQNLITATFSNRASCSLLFFFFLTCLCVRYSGCWTTMRQLKESVCHVPPFTATTCCTARSRNLSLLMLRLLGNSLDQCSWGFARDAWALGKTTRHPKSG